MKNIFLIKGTIDQMEGDAVRVIGAVTDEIVAKEIIGRLERYRDYCQVVFENTLVANQKAAEAFPLPKLDEAIIQRPNFPYDNVPKEKRTKEQNQERAAAKQAHKVRVQKHDRMMNKWAEQYNARIVEYHNSLSDQERKALDDFPITGHGHEQYSYEVLNMLPKDFMNEF